MPANTEPRYTLTENIDWGSVIAANANTAMDGTGTMTTIFTAGANGSIVNSIRVKSGSTTATSAAGVLRIFVNNGSTNATATNNTLIAEYVLPSVTASATSNTQNFAFPLNIGLEAGYKIMVTVATMAANSVWQFTAEGGDY